MGNLFLKDIVNGDSGINLKEMSLLMGNGFSISYDSCFRFETLIDEIKKELTVGSDADKAISADNSSSDLEHAIYGLDYTAMMVRAVCEDEGESIAKRFDEVKKITREAFVRVISSIHPEPIDYSKICSCLSFLEKFGALYTLNYDLLLYWTLVEDSDHFADGFGRSSGESNLYFKGRFSDSIRFRFLHGALHFYRDNLGRLAKVERKVDPTLDLAQIIKNGISSGKHVPVIVLEGDSDSKLKVINEDSYLSSAINDLKCEGSGGSGTRKKILILGHAAKENDKHIYEAINESKISEIYFCIHQTESEARIKSNLEAMLPDWTFSSDSSADERRIILVNIDGFNLWKDFMPIHPSGGMIKGGSAGSQRRS